MDYTFGFGARELARYGAKAVVFDALKASTNYRDVPIHPYVKVSPDADPADAQRQALAASRAKYYVVRGSSRYEFLPGTGGMTDSRRFVNWSKIGEAIQQVRRPTIGYCNFVHDNGLEPEETIPVIVQPMWAGSFGMVTAHPNQDMTMVDYFKDDDGEEIFGERPQDAGSFRDSRLERVEAIEAKSRNATSLLALARKQKFYARYREDESVGGEAYEHGHLMGLARQLFQPLDLFGDGYAIQGEFGPDRKTQEPVLYQLKPFMPKRKADFAVKQLDTDVCFGICRGLELPVVRIKGVRYVSANDFDLAGDSPDLQGAKELFRFEISPQKRFEHANVYQVEAAAAARERYGGGVCLAMTSFSLEDGLNFIELLEPAVVVIDDILRAGMIHNRTNLIQTVPVTIFGNGLFYSKASDIRISCDGIRAVVEEK